MLMITQMLSMVMVTVMAMVMVWCQPEPMIVPLLAKEDVCSVSLGGSHHQYQHQYQHQD